MMTPTARTINVYVELYVNFVPHLIFLLLPATMKISIGSALQDTKRLRFGRSWRTFPPSHRNPCWLPHRTTWELVEPSPSCPGVLPVSRDLTCSMCEDFFLWEREQLRSRMLVFIYNAEGWFSRSVICFSGRSHRRLIISKALI